MIQQYTILKVADNSGARRIRTITPQGGGTGLICSHRRHHLGLGPGRRSGKQGREGQGHPGGRRPGPQGDPPQGRILHPVRRQRRGHHRQAGRARRHPRLRPGRPRAAGKEIHEDRLARPGGDLMAAPFIRKNDQVFVRQGKDKGKTGKVLVGRPGPGPGARRGRRPGQALHPPRPVQERPGRDHGKGSQGAPEPPDALLLRMRPGRPGPEQEARGRLPGPRLRQVRDDLRDGKVRNR